MSIRSTWKALHFMSVRDIGLFLRSARTDAAIARSRGAVGDRAAFEAAYEAGDPWASADLSYRYQHRKYETLLSLLPPGRRFASALDLGSGVGHMSRMVLGRADSVLGLDVAQGAVDAAGAVPAPGLRFERADVLDLPQSFDRQFDLVVLADTLYYLQPMDDALLKRLALRVSGLLAPGGLCLLANHFFTGADQDSRLSRRIHRAFAWSPGFDVVSEHRRPFYLVTLLSLNSAMI